MPPTFQPGGNVYAPGASEAIPWPAGEWVFGRVRGDEMSIWNGVAALRMRYIISPAGLFSVDCPDDLGTGLIALTGPECWQVYYSFFCPGSPMLVPPITACAEDCADIDALCPDKGRAIVTCSGNTGCGLPGNIQSCNPGVGPGNFDMQAIGFTVLNAESLAASTTAAGTGSTIAAVTLGSVTFPGNTGAGASNLQDALGHQIWIGEFLGFDGIPLYVAVVSGAGPAVGPPAAPGWTCVMDGASGDLGHMSVFIYTGAASTGGGPCFSTTGDVVTDICERAGLTSAQIDVTQLQAPGNIQPSTLVPGYVIERPTPAADILKVLMQSFFFDACESGGKMVFVPRGLASKLTIPEADLGLKSDKAKLEETWEDDLQMPQRYAVVYNDPIDLYEQGKQEKVRSSRVVKTKQQAIITIPMVMNEDWAFEVAEKTLFISWLERDSFMKNLARPYYLLLDATDVIEFVYQNLTFTVRITETALGQSFAIQVKSVNENKNNYLSTAQGGGPPNLTGGSNAQQLVLAPTQMMLFDIPLLEDTDANQAGTGKYVALSSVLPNSWPGAVLDISADNASFQQEGNASRTPAPFGYTTGALGTPAHSPYTWDMVNTLTIKMASPTFALAGDSEQNVLNGSNMLIVGGEIVQFVHSVQNSDGSYTISKLLRGRRGTEWAAGFLGSKPLGTNNHAAGELVVVASAPGVPLGSSGLFRVDDSLTIVNAVRYYEAPTIGQSTADVTSEEFTVTGADRKPYAPVHLAGSRDISGNLTATWIRRTRIGWLNLSQDPVPLSEDEELYDVDVLNGLGAVVRTFSNLTSPTASYTAAEQVTDFGSAQASIALRVYQKSVEVGRGFAGGANV